MSRKTIIDKLYQEYDDDLKTVDKIIIDNCDAKSPLIKEMSSYIIESGGKRIRPILVLLSNSMVSNRKSNSVFDLCAAVELIHTATLLHDDVVDNSFLRRGKKTSNAIWDNKASILVGDFLFSLAFQFMVKTNSIEILRILSNASNVIADGEVNQLQNSSDIEISLDKYIEIIEGKTAALFAASCSSGGCLGEAKHQQIQDLHEIGNNLGILFQITDDILDYGLGSKKLGKNAGDDFFEGKVTLPIIFTFQEADKNDKNTIENIFDKAFNQEADEKDLASIISLIKKYHAIEKSITLANNYYEKSLSLIANFEDSGSVAYMKAIIDNVFNRIR